MKSATLAEDIQDIVNQWTRREIGNLICAYWDRKLTLAELGAALNDLQIRAEALAEHFTQSFKSPLEFEE